jgi:hypothetical protein
MTTSPRSLPLWLKLVMSLFGAVLVICSGWALAIISLGLWLLAHSKGGLMMQNGMLLTEGLGRFVGTALVLYFGIWLFRRAWRKASPAADVSASAASERSVVTTTSAHPLPAKNRHWSSCNILHLAPDAKRLWQFDARGGGFVLAREQRVPHAETVPAKGVAKSWASLWQPKLNIAWLPPESIFLRVIELPAANAEETFSMVELQLEKLSPMPVTQIVWTLHVLGTHQSVAKADGTTESLQTAVVVIAARSQVEEFLGRLEREGFLADRLEAPMLDQLEAVPLKEDGTWVFPLTIGGQNAALLAWGCGGSLRSLSLITLPAAGDRAAELKTQISLLAMAGEVEGWLTTTPRWHLVADPVNATEWENLLRTALGEPVQVTAPPSPAELAGRTARRAASAGMASHLLPAEFTGRYHEQFVDRLWLRGLAYAGLMYALFLAVYFSAVAFRGYQASGVEADVARISNDYTNAVQLKARYAVLQERAQLKYAALDSWQVVAQQLPPGIQVQRMIFAGGQHLTLSGSTTPDMINTLFDFDSALRKYKTKDQQGNEQQFFDPQKGDHVNPRTQNNATSWGCSLELVHAEADQP